MRHLAVLALFFIGCSSGSDATGPDAGAGPDGGPVGAQCPIAASTADLGAMAATKANMCNEPQTMGRMHWYKLATAMPGGTDVIELGLWDGLGAFKNGTAHIGTFTIAGEDAVFSTCGVCVRAVGDKGASGSKEYFATGGTVNVTAMGTDGQQLAATLSNLTMVEVDPTTHKPVASGCAATVAGAQVSGTIVQLGGGGGGTGGGGGGGGGCSQVIGD